MKIAWVFFVSLLFRGTPAQSQPGPPASQAPVQPASAPPTQTPPAPPKQPPAPQEQFEPQSEAQAATAVSPRAEGRWMHSDEYGWVWIPEAAKQPTADGEWAYTAQYGWLWMPYALRYLHEPSVEGAYPQAYVPPNPRLDVGGGALGVGMGRRAFLWPGGALALRLVLRAYVRPSSYRGEIGCICVYKSGFV
jgi:hypothetical protein